MIEAIEQLVSSVINLIMLTGGLLGVFYYLYKEKMLYAVIAFLIMATGSQSIKIRGMQNDINEIKMSQEK